jgi:hypothetical protein
MRPDVSSSSWYGQAVARAIGLPDTRQLPPEASPRYHRHPIRRALAGTPGSARTLTERRRNRTTSRFAGDSSPTGPLREHRGSTVARLAARSRPAPLPACARVGEQQTGTRWTRVGPATRPYGTRRNPSLLSLVTWQEESMGYLSFRLTRPTAGARSSHDEPRFALLNSGIGGFRHDRPQ